MRALVLCARAAARGLFAGLPGLEVRAGGPPDPSAAAWIVWGVLPLPPAPPGVRVLNRPAAAALLRHRAAVRERLRLAGLEPMPLAGLRARGDLRPLRVSLFDLRPYGVEVIDPRTGRWRPADEGELGNRTRERAVGAAIRALHALRLDCGRVVVGVGGPDAPEAVSRLELAPVPHGAVARALRQLVVEWLGDAVHLQPEVAVRRPPLHLGADPEFVLVDRATGEPVPASRYLPRAGSVGCDGHAAAPGIYPVAEVRPSPAADPRALVGGIRRCLIRAAARLPDEGVAWLAGGEPVPGLPTGGHVHLSGLPLSGALLRALDTYVALPVFLAEPPEAAARRRRRHGFLGDVRPKRHGGFEYRTLPSWLVSPELALAVLALVRLVALEHPRLPRDAFRDGRLVRAFYAGDPRPARRLLPVLRRDLEGLPGYGRWAREIETLLDRVAGGWTWDPRTDLRAAWRLPARMRAAVPAAALG